MESLGYRPYVSLDIETTGLNKDECDVLEIAAIFDDGTPAIDLRKLPFFHCFIKLSPIDYGEPEAIHMNRFYFEEYVNMRRGKSSYNWYDPNDAAKYLAIFISKCRDQAVEVFDKKQGWEKPMTKIQLAGKNVGSFDVPVLYNFFDYHESKNTDDLKRLIDHRFLDVGSKYEEFFGYNASLAEINKMTGRGEVTHDAYNDALDVIVAKRMFWLRMKNLDLNLTGTWR